MRKIGIVSRYYGNRNYGGILQAYALQRILAQMGKECVQIRYEERGGLRLRLWRLLLNPKRLFSVIRGHLAPQKKTAPPREISDGIKRREAAFQAFQDSIPHTREVYCDSRMDVCGEEFDTLVTGSDQVWNLAWFHPACFLHFAAPGQKKVSYAASVSMTAFTRLQAAVVNYYLRDFSAVSVREEQTAELLRPISPLEPVWTLDPTLLLTAEEWDAVCAGQLVAEPYLFCYFLGMDRTKCDLATEFARANGWKIVTIPYLHGYEEAEAADFGDYRMIDASPSQFLSLIKHAAYVMTDSFHACVFSNVYKRQYAVCNRSKSGEMSERIYSITGMLGQTQRFLDTGEKMTLAHLSSLQQIDYSRVSAKLEERKAISMAYLESI